MRESEESEENNPIVGVHSSDNSSVNDQNDNIILRKVYL
jgi:hypothetical protein